MAQALKSFAMKRNFFSLIYAPPGYGKTTGLLALFETLELSLVFISPLRAIAEEVYKRAQDQGFKVQWKGNGAPPADDKTFVVTTFESLNLGQFPPEKFLFVIDEFHLIYYWGRDFRPKLFETYYDLAAMGASVVGLTATLGDEIRSQVFSDAMGAFDESHFLDLGGGTLLFRPKFQFNFSLINSAAQLHLIAIALSLKCLPTVVFCSQRRNVSNVVAFFRRRGFSAIGCVGGEVEKFRADLEAKGQPQIIVATSVLGHGVNLKGIRLVCFLDKVDKPDFYLQMMARGGRDGKGFAVFGRQKGSLFSKALEILLYPLIRLFF